MHADSVRTLVTMANQISQFFESQTPDDEAASAQAVAGHLKLFWAPSMRRQLVEAFDRAPIEHMREPVAIAMTRHRDTLLIPSVHVAAEAKEIFPRGGGDAG